MRELIDASRIKAIWDSPYLLCHYFLVPVVDVTGMELEPLEQATGLEMSGAAWLLHTLLALGLRPLQRFISHPTDSLRACPFAARM